MSAAEALTLLGGAASRAQLIAVSSRAEVERAIAADEIVVLARGRYASPALAEARAAAHRLTGTVGGLSAALAHGWAVLREPVRPQVILPRNRRVTVERCRGVEVIRADLLPDDVGDGVTTAERTLVDCGRRLPDGEALAVMDSALRSGYRHAGLVAAARDARGPGAVRLRRIAAAADGRAANPFESGLRDLAGRVPGLRVRPQVPIYHDRFLGCPDLVDEDLRIVLEADSFEWHGGRADLARDARRYNRFVVAGWLVLRFAWEDVMLEPDRVVEILTAAVAERTQSGWPGRRPA